MIWRKSAAVSEGASRTGRQAMRFLDGDDRGSGTQSGSMHAEPTARCVVASPHGCGQLLRHCLFARLKITLSDHQRSRLMQMRMTDRGVSLLRRLPALLLLLLLLLLPTRSPLLPPPRKDKCGGDTANGGSKL